MRSTECNTLGNISGDGIQEEPNRNNRRSLCSNITNRQSSLFTTHKGNCRIGFNYVLSFGLLKLYRLQNLPPSSAEQMAETSIMMGRIREAETIFLHNKKPTEVVNMYLRMHQYEHALDIVNAHKIDCDFVLQERKRYLQALGKEEYNAKFLQLNNNK